MTSTAQKLVLGTVQLGMKYGLANTAGQPSKEEAFRMLDTAFEGGINTFDTASVYGSAEALLGEWIKARAAKGTVRVVSKGTPENFGEMEAEILASLKSLNLESLDGYLLPSQADMFANERLEALRHVRDMGLAAHVGVSVYEEHEALRALEAGLDYIQVPYNALDQRLDRADFFDRAKERGVTVFARSPFLQGLLLMQPEALPTHLSAARPHLDRFIQLSRQYGLSQLEAALLFSCGSRAQHVIFGAESQTQVAQILSIVERKEIPVDLLKEIRKSFQNVERNIIDPRLWTKPN